MSNESEPRMEIRALLAIILSMLVLTLYQYFFVPAPPAPLQEPEPPASAVPAAPEPNPENPPPVVPARSPEPAQTEAPVAAPAELSAAGIEEVTVHGARYIARVTNIGGRIESFVLTDYDDPWGEPLDLVHPSARQAGRLPLELQTPGDPGAAVKANAARFTVSVSGGRGLGNEREAAEGSPVEVVLRWADGDGWDVEKRLRFPYAGNQIGLFARATAPAGLPTFLSSGVGLDAVDHDARHIFLGEDGVALSAGQLSKWTPKALEGPVTVSQPSEWVGVESHYFLEAFLLGGLPAPVQFSRTSVVSWPPADPAEMTDLVSLAVQLPAAGLDVPVYLGPKKHDYLAQQGHDLDRVVDFGWLSIIARPLLVVLNWIYGFVGNYGVAIIILTILLRLVFWPLNHKAMVSMRKTQSLQPQMAAIRAKYQGVKDLEKRQKMNEEVMALYRREGVSPLGGCLPMLAQLPILFAFYRLLSIAVELRGAPFALWIHDLSLYDPYLVLPMVMGASMIVQQRMTPSAGANPTQARMMRFMPVMFTVMFLWVPSGLVLYWTANNLLGIGQQVYINKQIDKEAQARKQARGRGKKGQRGKR